MVYVPVGIFSVMSDGCTSCTDTEYGKCSKNRGSNMSAHGLLNLLNELGKRDKCEACRAFYLFFATCLINSIIQEHDLSYIHSLVTDNNPSRLDCME